MSKIEYQFDKNRFPDGVVKTFLGDVWQQRPTREDQIFTAQIGKTNWEFSVAPKLREVKLTGSGTTKLRMTGILRVELDFEQAVVNFFNSKQGYYQVTEGGMVHACRYLLTQPAKTYRLDGLSATSSR